LEQRNLFERIEFRFPGEPVVPARAPRVASAARVRFLLAFASCPPMRDAPISAASVATVALPSESTWSV
jgi:hypothetical protein